MPTTKTFLKKNDDIWYTAVYKRISLDFELVSRTEIDALVLAATGTVDATIIDGSLNAVAGNAVFDGLALKADLASIISDHTLLTNIGTNTHGQIDTHIASTSNPHGVTKTQVGLGNVDDTSDAAKPVSTATQTALNLKLALAGGTMTGSVFFTDNLYDIGAAGSSRPRSGYFGTSITAPAQYGGASSNDDLTIEGTSHATKATSYIFIQPSGGNVSIGSAIANTTDRLTVTSNSTGARTTALRLENNFSAVNTGVSLDFDAAAGATTTGRITNVQDAVSTERHLTFDTWTGAALTEKMRILGGGAVILPNATSITTGLFFAGSATNNPSLYSSGADSLTVGFSSSARYTFDNSGFYPSVTVDNVYDLGKLAANRWRYLYVGTAIGVGLTTTPTATLDILSNSTATALYIGQPYNGYAIDVLASANLPAMRFTHTGFSSALQIVKSTGAFASGTNNACILVTGAYTHTPTGTDSGRGIDITVSNNTASIGTVYGGIISATANTAGITVVGLKVDVASTSGTKYAATFDGGNVGVGTGATVSAKLHVLSTTEQIRIGYDTGQFLSMTMGATGTVTFDITGSSKQYTFNNIINTTGGIRSNNGGVLTSNFGVSAAANPNSTSTTASTLFAGATTINYRVVFAGTDSGTIPVGNSYTGIIVGTQAAIKAASGTHALFAQMVIKPMTITAGAATLTDSATLYLSDAATGATNNYNLWCAGTGINRFDGTVTMPTPFTLGGVSVLATGTELNFVDGVTSAIQTQLDAKAPLASPTFTGTVTIPTPFTLGAVSVLATGTELNFVDGVTSSIQTQLDAKQPLDTDLTTIAGLTATTDNFIVSVASAWASRTVVQVKTTLALNNVDNTTDAGKPVSTAQQTALDLKANLASPTFTGTVTFPTPFTLGAVSVLATGTELNYVDGVTSAIQGQIDAKAPLASPTFTGTVVFPTPFTIGAVSVLATGTELNFVDGVTSAIQGQIDAKAPLASPTFTGTVTIPTPFTLGAVSVLATGTELNFVDGVTSAIQTQIDAKQATLVSATNIKTINGSTVLGSGDLVVTGSGMSIGVALALATFKRR